MRFEKTGCLRALVLFATLMTVGCFEDLPKAPPDARTEATLDGGGSSLDGRPSAVGDGGDSGTGGGLDARTDRIGEPDAREAPAVDAPPAKDAPSASSPDAPAAMVECMVGAKRCAALVPQVCTPAGTWMALAACTYVCSEGGCSGECSPGVKRCTGSTPQT